MADKSEVIAKLRAWLLERRPGWTGTLDEHTDIIEARLLESLQLVEFLLLIERWSGRTVLSEELDPRELRTLGTLYRRFWETPDVGR